MDEGEEPGGNLRRIRFASSIIFMLGQSSGQEPDFLYLSYVDGCLNA